MMMRQVVQTDDHCPKDRMFVGETLHGVYEDELADVHPEVIEQYYGAEYSDAEERPPREDSDIDAAGKCRLF